MFCLNSINARLYHCKCSTKDSICQTLLNNVVDLVFFCNVMKSIVAIHYAIGDYLADRGGIKVEPTTMEVRLP